MKLNKYLLGLHLALLLVSALGAITIKAAPAKILSQLIPKSPAERRSRKGVGGDSGNE